MRRTLQRRNLISLRLPQIRKHIYVTAGVIRRLNIPSFRRLFVLAYTSSGRADNAEDSIRSQWNGLVSSTSSDIGCRSTGVVVLPSSAAVVYRLLMTWARISFSDWSAAMVTIIRVTRLCSHRLINCLYCWCVCVCVCVCVTYTSIYSDWMPRVKLSAQRNETETKQFQNSFKNCSNMFWNCFKLLLFQFNFVVLYIGLLHTRAILSGSPDRLNKPASFSVVRRDRIRVACVDYV